MSTIKAKLTFEVEIHEQERLNLLDEKIWEMSMEAFYNGAFYAASCGDCSTMEEAALYASSEMAALLATLAAADNNPDNIPDLVTHKFLT